MRQLQDPRIYFVLIMGIFLAFMQNIYAMELRSAQKPSEKPAPRFRLSLARSMGAGLHHNGRRCRNAEGGVYHHRFLKRRSRQCVPKPPESTESPRQRTLTLEKDAAEEEDEEEKEWEKEEEQQEKKRRRKMEKEEHHDIPHGTSNAASA